mgnify:CR=1 FL=1
MLRLNVEAAKDSPQIIDISQNVHADGKIPIVLLNRDGKKLLAPLTSIRKYCEYTEPSYPQYLKTWLNVYPNQYSAGIEILEFYHLGVNSVVLTAEMQSGKTGTIRYVVHALQHLSGPDKRWPVEKFKGNTIFFICGMNDNDLRQQACREFKGLIPTENILFSKQIQRVLKKGMPGGCSPSLIIVDESHYASQRDSLVDKFLGEYKDENCLELSVSATAMAQIAVSNEIGTGLVYLHPDKGYYGIRDIFRRGLIFQSIDITNNQQAFIDLVEREYDYQKEHSDFKYNIIRLPTQWYHKDLEDDLSELDLPIKYINFHTFPEERLVTGKKKEPDFNNYIASEPVAFTIIWVYGSLRAGKQLNTKHIGFVHDTAHSSPDIIAQALLGRILGYNKEINFVRCYTDVASARLMRKWVDSTFDVTKIPCGSQNIVDGYREQKATWMTHKPLLVTMGPDMRSHYRMLKQIHGNRYPYKDGMLVDIALSATDDRERIMDIFDNYDPGSSGGLMILTEDNKPGSFKEFWTGNYNSYLEHKPARSCNVPVPGNYYYVYVNLNMNSPQYGTVLITYKEYLNAPRDAECVKINRKSRFYKLRAPQQ